MGRNCFKIWIFDDFRTETLLTESRRPEKIPSLRRDLANERCLHSGRIYVVLDGIISKVDCMTLRVLRKYKHIFFRNQT